MKNLIARTLATALVVLASCADAAPQTKQAGEAGDLQAFRQNFIQAAEEYRASLRGLATSYEGDLRKAEERQEALKGLYADGPDHARRVRSGRQGGRRRPGES